MSTLPSRYRYPPIGLRDIDRCTQAIRLVAFVSIFTSPFWLWALFFSSPRDYSYTSSLICVPLLAIVGGVVILHFTQADAYLRRLLMTGLVARMAASSLFLWIGMVIYGGTEDAFHYWTVGLGIAGGFQVYGWSAFQPPYWSTNLIYNICGLAALLIGDALPTLFVAFAILPLAASYLYYRAFIAAFPDGDRWFFGLLVVLSPSLLFWSSFVGKDSIIQCFIALTCFGFVKFTQRHGFGDALVCAAGLAGILAIRAHVAAILAIAMTFPYVMESRASTTRKATKKVILIPLMLGATFFLLTQARNLLLDTPGANTRGGNETVTAFQEANVVTKNSQVGGSAFNKGTSLAVRIVESPLLMFRPFPWEIHNWLALASAIEALGWMILCYIRRHEILWTLRHWRDPYVGFLLVYIVVFSITFGATISNFGLLARQRIMMMPLVFMFMCAKPKLLTRDSSWSFKKGARMTKFTGLSQRHHIPTRA
jgi:hypothetical protein